MNRPFAEKRAGSRRPAKPPKSTLPKTVNDFFKNKKVNNDYQNFRYIICSDFTADDMITLLLFIAWISSNEDYYNKRNIFPIHSFIHSNCDNINVRTNRIRTWLLEFGQLMGYDNEESHLFSKFFSAGDRIWYDSNTYEIEGEEGLLSHTNFREDYPSASPFSEVAEEFLKNNPDKMVFLCLKEPHFLENLTDPQRQYFSRCHWFIKDSEIVRKYCKDFEKITIIPDNLDMLTSYNAKKFFEELENREDQLPSLTRESIYVFNMNRDNQQSVNISNILVVASIFMRNKNFKIPGIFIENNHIVVKPDINTIPTLGKMMFKTLDLI